MPPERILKALIQDIIHEITALEANGQVCLLANDFRGYKDILNVSKEVAKVLDIDLTNYE